MQYAYDALHRLTTATENGTFVLASYTYDPLSRRTGAAHGNGTSVAASFSTGVDLLTLANTFVGSSVTHTMTYKPDHRMKDETVSSAAWRFAPAAVETTTYAAANTLNQYTQVTKGANPTVTLAYDASGNLTGDGTWTFAYDAENKLRTATKSGTSASYAYDPLLRRQGKTVNGVTTTFLLDGAEEIGDYDGTGAMLRRFVPSQGTDAPIAMIEGTGGSTVRQWFHRNRLGSTIAMSSGTGLLSEGPITYDPFGSSTSTGGVPFKYTGRRYDAETGLYYYRARYYSPALGRFLQTDPIGTCDNLNLYAYVNNDPVNKTDPTGLRECSPPRPGCVGAEPPDKKKRDRGMRGPSPGAPTPPSNDVAQVDDGVPSTMESSNCDEMGVCKNELVKPIPQPPKQPKPEKSRGPLDFPADRSFSSCTNYCANVDPISSQFTRGFRRHIDATIQGAEDTWSALRDGRYGDAFWFGMESTGRGLVTFYGAAAVDGAASTCLMMCISGY